MREEFDGRGHIDSTEVETFNPDDGPPKRPRKKWHEVADIPTNRMDPDIYSTRKSVAQGFMDIALLSANADQLRNLIKTGDPDSPFYIVCVVFISLSLVVQVMIAICLLVKIQYNINNPDEFRKSEKVNNVCMVASIFLTLFNVLITSFMPEVPPRREMFGAAVTTALPFVPGLDDRTIPPGVEPVVG